MKDRRKRGMGGSSKPRKKAQTGLGVGSPYIFDDATGRYTLYPTPEAAARAAGNRRGVTIGDSISAEEFEIYKSQGAAPAAPAAPAKPKASGVKPASGPNTSGAVRSAGRKVSRTPKEGMFYLKDSKGNYVFYPQVKDGASMRTAAEKALPGSAGKVQQGTVDDLFMKERPDQMKKMEARMPTSKAKTSDRALKDMGIQESKEVKFDSPAPKADASKAVSKSKVEAAKEKQAAKTAKAKARAEKKPKTPSAGAMKRQVRQNTRQAVRDIKREGRQERKAIRRGMAESGLRAVPEGGKGKGLSKLPKAVRNKMGYKKYGGKK